MTTTIPPATTDQSNATIPLVTPRRTPRRFANAGLQTTRDDAPILLRLPDLTRSPIGQRAPAQVTPQQPTEVLASSTSERTAPPAAIAIPAQSSVAKANVTDLKTGSAQVRVERKHRRRYRQHSSHSQTVPAGATLVKQWAIILGSVVLVSLLFYLFSRPKVVEYSDLNPSSAAPASESPGDKPSPADLITDPTEMLHNEDEMPAEPTVPELTPTTPDDPDSTLPRHRLLDNSAAAPSAPRLEFNGPDGVSRETARRNTVAQPWERLEPRADEALSPESTEPTASRYPATDPSTYRYRPGSVRREGPVQFIEDIRDGANQPPQNTSLDRPAESPLRTTRIKGFQPLPMEGVR